MLKKHALLIAVIITLGLGVVSFVKISNMPNTGLSIEDKLFHCLAYFILTLAWFNYLNHSIFSTAKHKAILAALVFSVIYGTIIEVLQGQLTTNRVTEFYDAIANTIGALLAAILIKIRLICVKK